MIIILIQFERKSRAKQRDKVDQEIMNEANDEPQYTSNLLGEGGQGAVYECIYQERAYVCVYCFLRKLLLD